MYTAPGASKPGRTARIYVYRRDGQVRLSGMSEAVPRNTGQQPGRSFKSTPIPDLTGRSLAAHRSERLARRMHSACPRPDAYLDLRHARQMTCCEPLAGEDARRAGDAAGRRRQGCHLDPDLAAKGVVFTDLRTAERSIPSWWKR